MARVHSLVNFGPLYNVLFAYPICCRSTDPITITIQESHRDVRDLVEIRFEVFVRENYERTEHTVDTKLRGFLLYHHLVDKARQRIYFLFLHEVKVGHLSQ